MEPQFVSLTDAAKSLGIGLSSLRKIVDRGEIATGRVGRRRLIPTAEIRRYAARLAATAPEQPTRAGAPQ